MADEMRDIADLAGALGDARASDRRRAEKIAEQAEIDFTIQDDLVIAAVGATPDAGGRSVRFARGDGGIVWSCTCTADPSPWCKHAVAAILIAADRAGRS